MSKANIVKARYLGPVIISGAGGNVLLDAAVENVKKQGQSAKCLIHIRDDGLKLTDRSCRDVLLSANKDDVSCHGMQTGSQNFMCIVVTQAKHFYCHVFNLPKGDAAKAEKGLTTFYGGGGGEIIPSWKAKNKKLFKNTKKSMRRPSVVAAPSGFDQVTKKVVEDKKRGFSKEEATREAATFPRKFSGEYLGSQPVNELFGNDVVAKAYNVNIEERKKSGDGDDGESIIMVVQPDMLRTVERSSDTALMTHFIKNVSFTSVLPNEIGKDIFAYISVDKRIGSMQCHLFRLPKSAGQRAHEAVEIAFKVTSYLEKNSGDNPFAVTDPRREPAPEALFRRQIHRADLKAVRQIGAGNFGSVYIASQTIKTSSGIKYRKRAVKLLKNAAAAEDKAEFVHEAEVMLELDHPNLVRIIGVAIQQKPWLCVLEYMDYGDLRSLVLSCKEKGVLVHPGEHYFIGSQIAAGCAYLCSKRYVHMDIAARNVLVSKGNVAKLADFGLTLPMEKGKPYLHLREKMKLAIKWLALEGMDYKLFSEASDVWAFGVAMWEVATYGAKPYSNLRSIEVQKKIREGLRLPRPPIISDDFWNILTSCWKEDPKKRDKFEQISAKFKALHEKHIPPERDIGSFLATYTAGGRQRTGSTGAMAFAKNKSPDKQSRPLPQTPPAPTGNLTSLNDLVMKFRKKSEESSPLPSVSDSIDADDDKSSPKSNSVSGDEDKDAKEGKDDAKESSPPSLSQETENNPQQPSNSTSTSEDSTGINSTNEGADDVVDDVFEEEVVKGFGDDDDDDAIEVEKDVSPKSSPSKKEKQAKASTSSTSSVTSSPQSQPPPDWQSKQFTSSSMFSHQPLFGGTVMSGLGAFKPDAPNNQKAAQKPTKKKKKKRSWFGKGKPRKIKDSKGSSSSVSSIMDQMIAAYGTDGIDEAATITKQK